MNFTPPSDSSEDTPFFVPSLADQISPIQLRYIERDDEQFALDMTPTDLEPIFDLWPLLTPHALSRTLVIDPTADTDDLYDESRWTYDTLNWSSSSVAILDDAALRRSVNVLGSRQSVLVMRICGPIEARDIAAIREAFASGRAVLDADCRIETAAQIRDGRLVRIASRNNASLYAVAGRLFQTHLARVRRQVWSDFRMPAPWQMESLFEVTGVISVRPIETEVYSSFVDVGISITELDRTGPAGYSLIYDLISGTWHDEPTR